MIESFFPDLPPRRRAATTWQLFVGAALLSWTGLAQAQTAGTVKSSFNPTNGPNGTIYAAIVQADGKIVVGISDAVARLNIDGSVDKGFNAPTGLGRVVNLTASTYGKTVVAVEGNGTGGSYNTYQLLRLQADGTLDTNFSPVTINGSSVSNEINDVVLGVQSNAEIIAAGDFVTSSSTNAVPTIVRYNSDGTLDTGFKFSASTLNVTAYNAIVPQANGKILVAASATNNSVQNGLILLLNADGSVDKTYEAGLGQAIGAYAPTLQPDGKIVYLADLPQNPSPSLIFLGGVPRRLNADGTADTSFTPQFAAGASFSSLVVQSDGKIVVGGYTAEYSVPTSPGFSQLETPAGVARLNADGTVDTSFNAGTGAEQNGSVVVTLVAPDDSIVVAGNFGTFDGQSRRELAELNGDGGLDLPFFNWEATLSNGVYYLELSDGNPFGYYAFLSDPHYLYHFDLGYEYVFPAFDGQNGLYLYDFESQSFFYTSPTFGFPYLYDFTLNTVLYYYPDPNHAGRYNTNGVRYFYDFATQQIISK